MLKVVIAWQRFVFSVEQGSILMGHPFFVRAVYARQQTRHSPVLWCSAGKTPPNQWGHPTKAESICNFVYTSHVDGLTQRNHFLGHASAGVKRSTLRSQVGFFCLHDGPKQEHVFFVSETVLYVTTTKRTDDGPKAGSTCPIIAQEAERLSGVTSSLARASRQSRSDLSQVWLSTPLNAT